MDSEKRPMKAGKDLGFYELFGNKAAYGEIQATAKSLAPFFTQTQLTKYDGEVTSATVTVSAENEEQFELLLNQLKVYPWINKTADGSVEVSIDNKRECARLNFFNLLHTGTLSKKDSIEEASTEAQSIPEVQPAEFPNEYAFPLPLTPDIPHPKIQYPDRKKNVLPSLEDPVAVDELMQYEQNRFDSGVSAEPEEEKQVFQRKGPDLSLFKNRYKFNKDSIETPTGEILTRAEHIAVILAAKDDPKIMEQAVDMSIGLVKSRVDRVLKKFSTNEIFNEDDLFQAGLEGLLYGLQHVEAKEDSAPVSYLVPCIESYIRRFISKQKKIFAHPEHIRADIAKYKRAESDLGRAQGLDFIDMDPVAKKLKIAEQARMPLYKIHALQNVIDNQKVEVNDENLSSEYLQQEDMIRGAELQDLKEDFEKALSTLSPREDMIIRLRFGILENSRFLNQQGIASLFEESLDSNTKLGKSSILKKLLQFDFEKDEYDTLNPAEQMFLALIGKIPVSLVSHLVDGNYERSDATLESIGKIIGTSKDRVQQVEAKAIRKMRHPARSTEIRRHLDDND